MFANGWIKILSDGSKVIGTDQAVSQGKASWRNSSMNIVEAIISHNGKTGRIKGTGSFWQADDYETAFSTNRSKFLRRRISKQILSTDIFFSILTKPELVVTFFSKTPSNGHIYAIPVDKIGWWLNVEISAEGDSSWSFSKERR